MTTTKYKDLSCRKKTTGIFISIFLLCLLTFPLFAENGKWVIAAQKFELDKGLKADAVNLKTAETIPSDILEKIGYSAMRNVYPDELFERTQYKLRSERQSLFLQLSAEYKKRDSLVLSNYSDFKLKTAIKDSEKKIKDIQKKIDANLAELKKASDENEEKMAKLAIELANPENKKTELDRYKALFKNIFVRDESLIQQEQITFYKDDYTALYSLPEDQQALSIADPLCEKSIVSAGINSLITGHFSKYGDYISVYVELYSFPGAKKIGAVTEVGSVQELELINTSIVMQIIPLLANSLPVQLEISIQPEDAKDKTMVYIDNVLQKLENGKLIVDSGINTIQFVSEGYKNAGTTYNFEGNKKYKIDVNFEKPETGYIQIGLRKPIEGNLLMNGERALNLGGNKSQISINGKAILGEFIADNGDTAFFYIPQKMLYDGNYVTINPKPMDRMAYIDKRRKIMYGAYSAFILSLIPTFYTLGNYQNYVNLYKNYQTDLETARNWQTATNVTRFITIGCGVFWGYELVRYLIAANSVLPQNAKDEDNSFYEFVDPETLKEKDAANENKNETENNDIQTEKNGEQ